MVMVFDKNITSPIRCQYLVSTNKDGHVQIGPFEMFFHGLVLLVLILKEEIDPV
jgi:hypothetical protein